MADTCSSIALQVTDRCCISCTSIADADADSKDRFKAVSTLQTANSGEPASLSTVRSLSVSQVAPPSSNIQTTEVKLHVPHLGSSKAHETVQHGAQHAEHALHDQELDEAVLGCEEAYAAEVQHSTQVVKHHVPLLVLARDHWQGVLLQFLLEANYGATFYTFFSWCVAAWGCKGSRDTLVCESAGYIVYAWLQSTALQSWLTNRGTEVQQAILSRRNGCSQSYLVTDTAVGSQSQ